MGGSGGPGQTLAGSGRRVEGGGGFGGWPSGHCRVPERAEAEIGGPERAEKDTGVPTSGGDTAGHL